MLERKLGLTEIMIKKIELDNDFIIHNNLPGKNACDCFFDAQKYFYFERYSGATSYMPLEINDRNFTNDLIVSFSIKTIRRHIQQYRHSWKSSSYDLNNCHTRHTVQI